MSVRWEYRIWLEGGGEVTDRVRDAARAETSAYRTDVYLLCRTDGDRSAKLRGGTDFEVKRRHESADGLEAWVAAVPHPFPLSRATLADAGLGEVSGTAGTPQELVALARAADTLLVREVRKHRQLFSLGEVQVEITELIADGLLPLTVGIEAGRLADARAAVDRLGLIGHPNHSYAARIRAFA